MTRLGYIAHGAQPFEGFRGGSAFRAVVVVIAAAAVAVAIVVAGAGWGGGGGGGVGMGMGVGMGVRMGVRMGMGVGLAGQEGNGWRRHRVAADGGQIVLRPMMRLPRQKIALLT